MERFGRIVALLFLIYISSQVSARVEEGKAISIFNVVKFKNTVCAGGGNQNGTCYTAEECAAIKGTASGSCAEGYGVCCVVSLACGGSSKQNCTYLVQTAVTSAVTNPCTYTICPLSSNICRIKLDFQTFAIAGPSTATVTLAPAPNTVPSYGVCITDTFTVASSAGEIPVICGSNTGQHMYVDSDGEACTQASFTYGGTSLTRQYDIKVLQYDCRNEMGGPTGCLQYFTADQGIFSSFNYVTVGTTETTDTAHLANQDYNICIRRNNKKCRICYLPVILGAAAVAAPAAPATPASFGLSSGSEMSKADVGILCTGDYLEILGLASLTDSAIGITTQAIATARLANLGKICGQGFDAAGAAQAAANVPTSVCTAITPFNVRFVSDGNELETEGQAMYATQLAPSGRVGFSLNYMQLDC